MKLKQNEFEREMKLQLQRHHDALTQKHNDERASLLNEKDDLRSRYDGVCNQVMSCAFYLNPGLCVGKVIYGVCVCCSRQDVEST